jgi:hypothetical protein
MLDFDVRRSARCCAKTAREFRQGESFYSVLMAEGPEVVRYDYCQEAWDGPPADALGWWKTDPSEATARKYMAPNDVVLHYFQQLEGQPDKADVQYILTLLMIRRRIVRLEETETDEAGSEQLVVFCPRNETEYRVSVVLPSPERAGEIQNELVQLLYADAA